jgi:monoamine oxidase
MPKRHFLSRRRFLKQAALCTATFAYFPTRTIISASSPRLKIIVIGAGLAGLAAAYELKKSGHNVLILEAQDRVGGRVCTIRKPFSGPLFAEAGAMYCNDTNTNLLQYCKELGVQLVPESFPSKHLFYLKDKRFLLAEDEVPDWPVDLNPAERTLSLPQLWNQYISGPLSRMGDPNDWTNEIKSTLDRMSMLDFLKEQGASEGAVSLLRLGYLDVYGDGIETVSALQLLNILGREQNLRMLFTIKAGSDNLPVAIARRLGTGVIYSSAVKRIQQDAAGVMVSCVKNGATEQVSGHYLVVAVPFSVLRSVEFAPTLSNHKNDIVRSLKYTSVTRIFLESGARFWASESGDGAATVDLPIMRVLEQPLNSRSKNGILEAFLSGARARDACSMTDAQKTDFALQSMEKVHPEIRKSLVRAVSKCWDEDEWERGAFCWFKPGEMVNQMPEIMRPEGRIHFAGEHTSWRTATMDGAIESGIRAANEIMKTGR